MLKFHQFENKYILLKKNNGKCIKGENVKLMEFVFSVCVCCFLFMEFSKLLLLLLGSLFLSTCAIFLMKELYLK